jgi:hypothetical protein
MAISTDILEDLKAVKAEGHQDFSFLSLYKGVPLVCRAQLYKFGAEDAQFIVQPPESAALQLEKVTLVLSDGLLEPLEAKVTCLDLANGLFSLSDFNYAGSRFANRRELRVKPAGDEKVKIASNGHLLLGKVADISVRGLGVLLPKQEQSMQFSSGKLVAVTLELPEESGKKIVVKLEGKIRSQLNMAIDAEEYQRLAIEFSGAVPEKKTIIHYVMRRRSEIVSEVRQLFVNAVQLKD